MKGKLIDLAFSVSGKQRITIEVNSDFAEKFDELKDCECDIEIKKHYEHRTLQANAYFHLLVGKIADEKARQGFNESNDEVKRQLVTEYGTYARDNNGGVIGFKLPESVDVNAIYPYTRCFDSREENGRVFNCYLVYKRTSLMNNAEMCRLIDGTIQVAQGLGIETDTPEELAKRKAQWESYERSKGDK